MTFAQVMAEANSRSIEQEKKAVAAQEARRKEIRDEMAAIEEGMKKKRPGQAPNHH